MMYLNNDTKIIIIDELNKIEIEKQYSNLLKILSLNKFCFIQYKINKMNTKCNHLE